VTPKVKSKRSRLVITFLLGGVILIVGLRIELEMKVSDAHWKGDRIYVGWWDKTAPSIRVSVQCDEINKTCEVRLYRSYWPWPVDRYRRQHNSQPLPKYKTFKIIIPNLELPSDK
jgi:hypothetical protein